MKTLMCLVICVGGTEDWRINSVYIAERVGVLAF